MKLFLLAGSLFLTVAEKTCKPAAKLPPPDTCFKGRLEVKANCMNYTVSILEGNMDTALYVPAWTDESTGKTYKNVFALGSKCSFPANINQGDEFYFTIDNIAPQNCAVCMLYYPVPPKKLSIRVITDPCTK